jgi:hypothetical protein
MGAYSRGEPFQWATALTIFSRSDFKVLPGTITVTYFSGASLRQKKGLGVIKLFFFVIVALAK